MIVIEIVLHETNIWKWRRAVVVFHVKLAQSTKMRFCEVDKVLEDTLDDEIHETDNYHRQHQGWDGRQRSISWRSKTTHGSAVSPIRVCWGHTRKKNHNLCLQNGSWMKWPLTIFFKKKDAFSNPLFKTVFWPCDRPSKRWVTSHKTAESTQTLCL